MKALENLRAWEALVVAAKTGSITRTALVLDMEITRVSRLLTDLEAECGIVFFDKRRYDLFSVGRYNRAEPNRRRNLP